MDQIGRHACAADYEVIILIVNNIYIFYMLGG